MELMLLLLQDMFFAAIPAVGFALVFNVPKRALKYCGWLGAMGHGLRFLLIHYDVPIELATLIASFAIGCVGIILSRRIMATSLVFTVAAIIPMIPGVLAYKAMIALMEIHHQGYNQQFLENAVTYFLKATFIVGALALGLALPSLLFYRRRRII